MNNMLIHDVCGGNIKNVKYLLATMPLLIECEEIAFCIACENLNIPMAELFLSRGINIHSNNEHAFYKICTKKNTNMMKWFIDLGERYDIHIDYNSLFTTACRAGEVGALNWLLSLKQLEGKINIKKHGNYVFQMACLKNNFNMAKCIYEKCEKSVAITDSIFYKICLFGNLDIAKWLYKKSPQKIYMHADNDKLLRDTCLSGKIHIIEWLLSSNSFDNNALGDVFAKTCLSLNTNNLNIIKKIWNHTDIERFVNLTELFIKSYDIGNIEIARWIYSLNKLKFKINKEDFPGL